MSSEVKTTDDLRARAPSWTLADDVDLRRHLENLAESIESQAKGLQQSLDQLEHKLLATQTSIGEEGPFFFQNRFWHEIRESLKWKKWAAQKKGEREPELACFI